MGGVRMVGRIVRFAREGMCIDLGGFAKGHAVDCAAAHDFPSLPVVVWL